MVTKGITVFFRDSQYKKKIRLLVNTCLAVNDPDNADKLVRKLDKQITEYFNQNYRLGDFILSGLSLIADIDIGNRESVSAYLKNHAAGG